MTHTEIARRLHDLVDQLMSENTEWEQPVWWYPTLRITYRSDTDAVTLVVGIEPAEEET